MYGGSGGGDGGDDDEELDEKSLRCWVNVGSLTLPFKNCDKTSLRCSTEWLLNSVDGVDDEVDDEDGVEE